MVNWKDIHEDFAKTDYYGKTYQQSWEETNLTYQDAQEWTKVGLTPDEYELVSHLKQNNFTPEQYSNYKNKTFQEQLDYFFNKTQVEAINLNNLKSNQLGEQSREDLTNASQLIIADYPNLKRIDGFDIPNLTQLTITNCPWLETIDIHSLKNNQQLTLNNLPSLKKLDCSKNSLTALDLSDCANLERIGCSYNKLTQIKLPPGEKLEWLWLSDNNLNQDLSFLSSLVGLKLLELNNNPLHGGLEYLKEMSKLERIDISNTDINSGLEYLPDSLKYFGCSINKRKEAKVKAIYNLFANKQGKIETKYVKIKNFPQKLQDYKQWRNLNFSEEEIRQWIIAGGFTLNDHEAANHFKQKDFQLNILVEEIIKKATWQDINPELKYWLRKNWKKQGFNKEQTKQWITAGAKPDDAKFVAWLRDIKNYEPEWIADYKEDYQTLSDRFKKYGLCYECKQPNTGEQWCKACNAKHLFPTPISNNPKVNEFIQKYQLQATDADKFLEWIPYEQFMDVEKLKELQTINSELQSLHLQHEKLNKSKIKQITNQSKIEKIEQKITDYLPEIERLNKEAKEKNIEHIADGGFGKVYKAKWSSGNVHHWGAKNNQWHREKDHYYEEKDKVKRDFERNKDKYKKYKNHRAVVLKILTNSQTNTDFLQEAANHKIVDDWFNNIVSCYGLSQDPETGNYLMVMQYLPEGNLRQYLSKKNKELSLQDKLSQLLHIAQGLKDIHSKNLIHRDFHLGNILKGIEKTSCLITDLGLCKPADEISKEEKVFGVMPYVSPEVLQSQPYTQASDIYSFGIVAYEMLSGLPPYYDRSHDISLALKICDTKHPLRPQLQIKIPPLLEDLIKQCWDTDPQKRPTTNKLERILRGWEQGNTEFKSQLQAAEEYNKTLPDDIKFPDYQKKIHSGAVYHSQLLPTKEITRLLAGSKDLDLSLGLIERLEVQEKQTEDLETQNKRQLSLESQTKTNQGETKSIKITEQPYQTEPMQINIQSWTNHHFTPTQAQEWINLNPPTQQESARQEPAFYAWLRDTKNLTPEQVLNHSDLNALRQEYQTQQKAQILHNPPKP